MTQKKKITQTGSSSKRAKSFSSKSLSASTVALINAIMLVGTAHSQTTNAPAPAASSTNAPAKLPDVIVTGQEETPYKPENLSSPKYTEPLLNIPQTITIIPREVMEDQGATTLRDVLRNVPGISIQAGEGGGGLPGDNLSIRGFNARPDLFVDGVRDYGAYSRDPFNIEQVEVTKGPSSSTSGRGSAGGSVNLVSKTPQLNSFYDGTLGFGTADYHRATLDVNQSLEEIGLDNAAFRLNGMWHDAGVPGRDVVEETRWAVAPSISFGLNTPTRVTLSYLHMTQDNIPSYGLPWVPANTNAALQAYSNEAPPVDFGNFYGLKNYDFEEIENDLATAIIEHDVNESITLRNLSRYGRTERDSAITAPRFANVNTSTLLNRQLQRRNIENEIFANQTDVKFEFATGPVQHALVGGFEFTLEDQKNRNSAQNTNQPQTDLFNPNPNDVPFGPMPPITGVPSKGSATGIAPYVFDTLKFGEQWQLNGGLRWDRVDAEYRSGTNRFDQVDEMLSWRAGIVFKPRPNGSIYFGYGTSFNPSIDGNVGMALTAANTDLDPEETRSFELGTKWDFFQERLSVSTALFRTEKTNARTPGIDPNDPPTVLDGEQVVHGVELGIAGQLTKDWMVMAAYTLMDTEIDESNNPLEEGQEFSNAPDHSFSLWTTYQLPWDLEIGAGAQYVGERRNGTTTTARTAPDYWLFDAMLAYHASKNVTLRLNVYNLDDEEYIDRVGGGHFIPGAGRSAVLSANFRF